MFCIRDLEFICVFFHQIFIPYVFLRETLSFFLLLDGPGNSRCVLLDRAYMCARDKFLLRLRKIERKDTKLLERVFFLTLLKK